MQDTGSILNIQEMTHTFLVKICLIFNGTCISIDITLSKTVADDLLQCEKIGKWCLIKLTGCKAIVNGSHCSKFQSVKRASVKQLFKSHLGLRIISFTNLRLWKKWCE